MTYLDVLNNPTEPLPSAENGLLPEHVAALESILASGDCGGFHLAFGSGAA